MDQSNVFIAKIKGKIISKIMYKMIHTGTIPSFMENKLNKMKIIIKQ